MRFFAKSNHHARVLVHDVVLHDVRVWRSVNFTFFIQRRDDRDQLRKNPDIRIPEGLNLYLGFVPHNYPLIL
jgi:hypothetical protein